MTYPDTESLNRLVREIEAYAQLKTDGGAKDARGILARARKDLRSVLVRLKRLDVDPKVAAREPDDLASIRRLRPAGPRRMSTEFSRSRYLDKLEGSLLGRMAGCTLGAPVELWPFEKIEALAKENGEPYPPTDYWSYVPEPASKRYGVSRRDAYTRSGIDGVPVDDDIVYTLLGLLIVEEHGLDFTVDDVGKAWLKFIPYACTAEEVALKNLKKGIPARRAAIVGNPYREWIGADIRSDPWGYMAPGWPEKAAELAHRDAFISHRRQGIYGEMYFAAAIAAAFETDDPVEALRIGLTEIPRDCAMARTVKWALKVAPEIRDYKQAHAAARTRFPGMSPVHTLNNACLTVWGITIGGKDFSRVIGETVAMGFDNDCTAATAGSIVGAVVGKRGIPSRWTKGFNNTIHTYLKGRPRFTISGVLRRFAIQASRAHEGKPRE